MKFEELLTRYNVPYVASGNEHCRPGWLQLDCPFCSRNWKHYRMGYNLARKYVHCWSCGSHSLISTVMEITGLSFKQAREIFQDLHLEQTDLPERVKSGKLTLPKHIQELQRAHIKYLRDRGYSVSSLKDLWDIKGIGLASKLSWRIFIPIYYKGKIVSWTTRAITDSANPRYISASFDEEIYPHKELLYGEEWCKHSVIVCEGAFDVWRIGPGAVAVMGTSYTRAQVHKISKYPRRIICFDTDSSGKTRSEELASSLEPFPGETIIVTLETGKDPGEATDGEINKLRKLLQN